MDAVETFNKLLKENGLQINFTQPKIRNLSDGAVLIEKQDLVVTFTESKQKEIDKNEKK